MTTQIGTQVPAAPRARRRHSPLRTAVRHYLEMVVAMVVGMVVLGPVWDTAAAVAGGTARAALDRPDVAALVMATDMTVGMSCWMRYRRHGWAPVAEMGAAMYAPFLLLLVPYWTGLVSGGTLHLAGHLLTLPAMAVAMLLRRHEYTHHRRPAAAPAESHGTADRSGARRFLAAVARRWPTLLALLVTVDNWVEPSVPSWALLVLPLGYLVIGGLRSQLRDRRTLAVQIAGLVGCAAVVLVAVSVDAGIARYVVAAGWLAHAAWDVAHHRADAVVPRPFAEWCAVVDTVIGVTILFVLP